MKYTFDVEFCDYWTSTHEVIHLESSSEATAWQVISRWAEYEMDTTGWGSCADITCLNNGKMIRVREYLY